MPVPTLRCCQIKRRRISITVAIGEKWWLLRLVRMSQIFGNFPREDFPAMILFCSAFFGQGRAEGGRG